MEYLSDFVGNKQAIRKLKILITCYKKDPEYQLPNIGLFGPAGCGKTMLATIIANETNKKAIYLNSTVVKNANLFRTELKVSQYKYGYDQDFLFILDEAHMIADNLQNNLLSLLENPYILSTVTGGKIYRDNVDNASFVFITTDPHKIIKPLKNRLTCITVKKYSHKDVEQIGRTYLAKKKFKTTAQQLIPNNIFTGRDTKQIVDFIISLAISKNKRTITQNIVDEALKILGINKDGLTESDLAYLKILYNKGSASLANIELMLGIDKKTIRNEIEKKLLDNNFIEIYSSGRTLTPKGMVYLTNLTKKENDK